jgi:hypothetical protein
VEGSFLKKSFVGEKGSVGVGFILESFSKKDQKWKKEERDLKRI